MKKTVKLFFSVVIAFAIGTTAHAQKTTVSYEVSYQEASAKIMEPTGSIMAIPIVCDINVTGGIINYTEKDSFKDYEVTVELLNNISNFKKIALCKAAQAYNADIIIAASILVNTNSAGKLEITVSGYPAKYENFRNASKDDLALIGSAKGLYVDKSNEILGTPSSQVKLQETQTKREGLSGLF